jgi:glyoxylase-like metal-dependent hydrolase (beta-lactamase superfamily II)
MEANCYILAKAEGSAAVIIDPGESKKRIDEVLKKHKLKAGLIINTHGHYDHIGCDDKFAVPIYIHTRDMTFLRDSRLNLSGTFAFPYEVKSEVRAVEHNSVVELDGILLKVLHIPGHTPGGIALLMEKPQDNMVFTGDSLFCQGIGRSDLPGGDEFALIKYIKERLLTLPDDTIVYPGHGPSSTIGEEKRNNPFLN